MSSPALTISAAAVRSTDLTCSETFVGPGVGVAVDGGAGVPPVSPVSSSSESSASCGSESSESE